MSGTATTPNDLRNNRRARPFVRSAQSAPTTPILFRLPWIQAAPQATASSGPTLTSMARPLSEDDSELMHRVPVEEVHATSPPAPPRVSEYQSNPPQPTIAVRSEKSTPVRSWWEHWSSGIVLILLVIALVTASILAFHDGRDAEPEFEFMTGAPPHARQEFDLDNIQVPQLDRSSVQPSEDLSLSPSVAEPRTSTTSTSPPSASAADNTARTDAADEKWELDLESDDLELSIPDSAIAAGGNRPSDNQSNPQQSMSRGTTPPTDTSSTSVSLSTPIGVQREALSPELPYPPSLSDRLSIPAVSVSESNVSSSAGQSGSPAKGDSPAFYDGAAAAGPSPSAGMLDTNLPAYSPALLAGSSTGAFKFDTASQVTVPAGVTPSTAGPQPISTATPEDTTEQYIKAYQYFKALNKAQLGGVNLYTTAPGGGSSQPNAGASQPSSTVNGPSIGNAPLR